MKKLLLIAKIKSHHYRPDPMSMGCAICFTDKKGYHLKEEHKYGTGIRIEKLTNDPRGYKWFIDEAPIYTGEEDDFNKDLIQEGGLK